MHELVTSKSAMRERAGAILRHLEGASPLMVEVGVSSGTLASGLLSQHPAIRWFGVDPWQGAEHSSDAYIATGDGHATMSQGQAEFLMQRALDKIAPFEGRASVFRARSPEAAENFEDGGADLVFLDGAHDYESVLADCRAWWPKVRPGGWLGGHDYEMPRGFTTRVREAVEQFAREVGGTAERDQGNTWFMRRPTMEAAT